MQAKNRLMVWVAAILMAGTGFGWCEDAPASDEIQSGTIAVQGVAEKDYPKMARVKLLDAVDTVLQQIKGDVLRVELENENDFLIYGVEVVSPDGTLTEFKLDAGSGKILARNLDRTDREEASGEREGDESNGDQGENEKDD